uniref:JmjC domain-containing protein 5 n=1 Tax=Ciona intestinalis TaxID=7719 RepID=F7AN97_CIOIN|nr:jmjC domain-containing protein 5 [Ciona intestinalis]|eukprot:XP_002129532.1 jmjC domain-containing protein 5 [Ciona intestinalis]
MSRFSQENIVDVPRLNTLDKLEFEESYLRKGKPVVITAGLDGLACSKWSIDYLLERVGLNNVTVRGRTNSDEYKVGKQYIIRETTFREYISDMRAKSVRGLTSYMAVQNISKTFPQLQDDCKIPDIGKLHNGPFLWVAHKGHYEYCHYDPDASLLMMIEGSKRVKLFSCIDLEKMYPNPLGSRGKTIQSQVDCDNVDLEKFPKFSEVTCYSCTLQAGDLLLIPAFWWHQVTSLSDSVSMNAFFGESGEDRYITRIMEEPVWPSFKYWLLNIVEQNRPFASFERTLQRLPLCVENLLLKQFHEVAPQSHVNKLVETIKEYLNLVALPEFNGGGKNPPPLRVRGLRWR